jgi:hypothetical protein
VAALEAPVAGNVACDMNSSFDPAVPDNRHSV